jgi:hypothetical protein
MLLDLIFIFDLFTTPTVQVIDDDPEPVHKIVTVD